MTRAHVASFLDAFDDEIEVILAKYPADRKRSAVMPLLFLAQRQEGYVTPRAVEAIAHRLGLGATEVGSLVGFYTLFASRPLGRHRMQICTDLPCALRGADGFAREVGQRLGVQVGETTSDGLITLEEVMCLAACHQAPMFQVQDSEGLHYHESQTVETAMEWVDSVRGQRPA